jgi:cation diffusion facilitator family transporter
MCPRDLRHWRHDHDFGTAAEQHAERRTRWVAALTFVTMLVELTAGWLTGSMALTADGWHMASHVGALGLAAAAYRMARRRARDARFTFGTGKVPALAGYSSALLLGVVSGWMAWESVRRLFAPVTIHYPEAMGIALLGLVVNLSSAWLLGHRHDHHGHRDHDAGDSSPLRAPDGRPAHVDHNLRAAYLHVLADALTSMLAVAALVGGMLYGWRMLDPLMGLAGAAVVGRWAWRLACDSGNVLLDAENHDDVVAEVRRLIEAEPDHQIADLHVWRIGAASRAGIIALVAPSPRATEYYRRLLLAIPGLDHVTVEVHACGGGSERRTSSGVRPG